MREERRQLARVRKQTAQARRRENTARLAHPQPATQGDPMTALHAAAILAAVGGWITLWTLVLVVIADKLTDGGKR